MVAGLSTTSSIANHTKGYRRRADRYISRPPSDKRRSYCTSHNRYRIADDTCLNSPVAAKVNTLPDRAISLEKRVMINLRRAEIKRQPSPLYFDSIQSELEPFHREQAVDWLADVSKELRCRPDILPLATNILDRYLSQQQVFPQDIQAVAGVCLMLASKLKEPTPINANNLAYYSSGAIEADYILSYEILILLALDWDVAAPTPFDFYEHVVARLPRISVLRSDFIYLIHEILRDYTLSTCLPSIQCGLALLSAAKGYDKAFYREIAGLSSVSVLSVPAVLGVDVDMLLELIHIVDSSLDRLREEREIVEFKRALSQSQALKTTPLSSPDSGFNSRASTPEQVDY